MKPYLLVLENFQSLRERTEIPISSLTFLYGPNSAGKSCIDDALALISTVFVGGRRVKENHWQLFKRWMNYSPARSQEIEKQSGDMCLELHCQVGRIFDGPSNVGSFGDIVQSEGGLCGWFDKSGWNIVLGLEGNSDGLSSLTLSAGSENVFRITWSEDGHSLEISLKAFGSTFSALADKHSVYIETPHEFYKIDCAMVMAPTPVVSVFNGVEDIDRDLVAIVNALFEDIKELEIAPTNLGADRSTIKSSSLSAICSGGSRLGKNWFSSGLPPSFHMAPKFDIGCAVELDTSFMGELARSSYEWAYREKNPRAVDESSTINPAVQKAIDIYVTWNMDFRPKHRESLHFFVNRCLCDHLFLDQGYQLVFEALEIKPATNIEAPPLSAALMIGSLVDHTGRRMTFEDVGTGISCVIPVLVAVHSGNGFIQQPELHLHPALQSALGDVFVEATKVEHAYHFIETHSEYILLRCLRRVRETTAGKHSAGSPLALTPDALSVLYFEPQLDGSTRVKKIRVSTQGDFIDRWPRGFFEERGKELFDE